ncbi:glycosyltransferase family 4 protein [Telmatocola sphagniphila]|uniref:Glycosyltransferase family 4 protein n=1 Tax=Telmatocola sphagniphila TaxID=1123043 RepID=A0A8E6B7J4_9BACT|nr:glycosyltransferase family 4 protein [Telmatocola sphagniphila]QVL31865.1 glycosyltransferase family 4 protein [Telmatocola sphagniphila]
MTTTLARRSPRTRTPGTFQDQLQLSTKPRIAYLVNQYPMVSHTFIRREIAELEKRGYQIERVSLRSTLGSIVDPADKLEAEKTYSCLAESKLKLLGSVLTSCALHPLRTRRALWEAVRYARKNPKNLGKHLAYLVEAVRLVDVLKSKKIDHVHVHFGTNAATVAVLMKRLADVKFSMTVHGSAELDSPLTINLPAKVAEAEFTAAISHYTKAQLMRFCDPVYWKKIHIVPCTVDQSFLADPQPIPEGSRNLVCVGRLSPEKGQLLLLEAFAEAIGDGTPGKLVLVGDGPVRSELEKRIVALDLQNRVVLAGWQNESQIRQHVRASRALVLPSFYEGLPVVLMEAMAMARPVLATPVGGIPELVKDGENGWLIPAGDAHEWAKGIRNLLKLEADECDRLGKNGRLAVQAKHAPEVAGDRIEKLFEQLLSERA